jgi:hypothetical protein
MRSRPQPHCPPTAENSVTFVGATLHQAAADARDDELGHRAGTLRQENPDAFTTNTHLPRGRLKGTPIPSQYP